MVTEYSSFHQTKFILTHWRSYWELLVHSYPKYSYSWTGDYEWLFLSDQSFCFCYWLDY